MVTNPSCMNRFNQLKSTFGTCAVNVKDGRKFSAYDELKPVYSSPNLYSKYCVKNKYGLKKDSSFYSFFIISFNRLFVRYNVTFFIFLFQRQD